MYFRRTKKLQGEVSLNEAIETDGDGAELSIGDVVGKSDTMLEDLQDKDDRALVRRLVADCKGTVYLMREQGRNEQFYLQNGFINQGLWRQYQ